MMLKQFNVAQLMIIFLCQVSLSRAAELNVAVASNFRTTFETIEKLFESETGIDLKASYGSSGKIFTQISNGAPFDVFLSADRSFVDRLGLAGLGAKDSVFVYAVGKLVLWSKKENYVDSLGKVLSTTKFKHLAIANPKLAPYGLAAEQVLKKLKLWDRLQPRVVSGENIDQTFLYVASANAELGFVAYSQIQGVVGSGSFWLVPKDHYLPLDQAAVLLVKSKNQTSGHTFLRFLKSDKVKLIIKRSGYDLE